MRSRTTRTAGRRLIAGLSAGLLLASGCGRGAGEDQAQPPPEPATTEVEVHFTNDTLGDACTDVFPVRRTVDNAEVVRATLGALLAGPSDAERAEGYGGWFGPATADALRDVQLIAGTAHVTFADLRSIIPNASTSCGSSSLLAMLDTTLLALDGVDATRYALADQTAFYEWLQLADPDAPPPADDGSTDAYDPDAGWTWITLEVPISLGCCGEGTTGPVSPDGVPAEGAWPADGFYDVDAHRLADPLATVRLRIRRFVDCDEVGDWGCAPDPQTGQIVADPRSEVVREIATDELTVVLVPLDPAYRGGPTGALLGEPPAFAELLTSGIDAAYRTWVYDARLRGEPMEDLVRDLLERTADPTFPFGEAEPFADDMLLYRGPLDSLLLAHPSWLPIDLWPPGGNGLYAWGDLLEIRGGEPILYLWANQVSG